MHSGIKEHLNKYDNNNTIQYNIVYISRGISQGFSPIQINRRIDTLYDSMTNNYNYHLKIVSICVLNIRIASRCTCVDI